MKARYDVKTKSREFKEGDKVLAYLPVPGFLLSAKYQGFYMVKRKIDGWNYILNTPDHCKSTPLVHTNLIKLYLSRVPAPDPDSHDVEHVPGTNPIRQSPYRVPHKKEEQMEKEVNYILEHGLADPSRTSWASPCLLAPKESEQFRGLLTGHRRHHTQRLFPSEDWGTYWCGWSVYIHNKNELTKKFSSNHINWKGPTERAQIISAFATPFGLFQYAAMSFGLRNAPVTFQRTMNNLCVLRRCIICTDIWRYDILGRLHDAHLIINLAKTNFDSAVVTYLGHEVGQGKDRPGADVVPRDGRVLQTLLP